MRLLLALVYHHTLAQGIVDILYRRLIALAGHYLGGLGQQTEGAHLERHEVFVVVLRIVVVAVGVADEFEVGLADYHRAQSGMALQNVLGVELPRILQGFVVVAETAYLHVAEPVGVVDSYLKVAHQVVGEVIARQLKQQLVGVDGVGLVDDDKLEVDVALVGKRGYRVSTLAVEQSRAAAPHVADVKLAATQLATRVDAIDYHARQRAYLALRILLYHAFEVGQTAVGLAHVELGQRSHKEEFVAVVAHGEALLRHLEIAHHVVHPVGFEGGVGGGVERVFEMGALAGVGFKVGVGEDGGPLALGIVLAHQIEIVARRLAAVAAHIEQEEVVIDLVHVGVALILVGQTRQVFLAQPEVVELVLEYHAGMEEAVHNQGVALFHLLGSEGYLGEVVLALVRVVLQTVGGRCQRVLQRFLAGYGVALLVGEFVLLSHASHHGLVDALPVVHILSLAPQLLEGGLALAHGDGVVEVPLAVACRGGVVGPRRGVVAVVAHIVAVHVFVLLLHGVGFLLGAPLFAFLLLECVDDAVYGGVAVFLAHAGERLERVLQLHGVGVGHQLVEYLGAVGELAVVGAVLVQQAYRLAIAAAGVAKLLLLPVEVAQTQQQHALLYTVAHRLLGTLLIGTDGMSGVAVSQIDVADGIVYLVEIFLVVVRCSHTAQTAYHAARLPLGHYLGLGDAGVELELVGRVEAHHAAEGVVGRVGFAHGGIELAQQIPLAGSLLAAHLVAYHAAQIGDGALIFGRVYVVVGIGVVPLLDGAPVHGVARHVAYHVFGVVEPALLHIALGKPGAGLAIDGGLGGVEAAHVGEGRGGFVKLAHVKLRAPHEHPGFPEEGVILATAEPLDVALGLAALLVPHGAPLDAVLVYGFLGLGHRTLKVALAQLLAVLVADGVEGYQFGIVVAVALFLFERAVYVCHRTVVVGVVARVEGMPEPRRRGVLLRRA